MRTRKAILPDAKYIHELISGYSGDGTLLPRTLAEICENARDFAVLENEGRIIGYGALHLYGTHLAEIRCITVGPLTQGHVGPCPPGEVMPSGTREPVGECGYLLFAVSHRF